VGREIWVKSLKRKRDLTYFNDELKRSKNVEECGLDSSGSGSVASCCEYENEHCYSIKLCI
jgi:hypothetical protein